MSEKNFEELLAMSDSELEAIFMQPKVVSDEDGRRHQLEHMMPEIIRRLNRKHANVQFVFEDYYHKECPSGYGYTQFKKYISSYREKNDYSYHNVYEPGREWQIDFAGDALFLTDKLTKVKQKLIVLVCVMPYSNLPFMMAMPKATTEWFFHGLILAMLREHGYLVNERNKSMYGDNETSVGPEDGFEWVEMTDFDTGQKKRIRKRKTKA